ncbi:hypothetical protein [Bremerella sp.]|uniref:DUF7710 domain-containing protein n=1 Tax=Bremerella sp. TaxID=2795602 RepID=UPI003918B884
MSTDEEQAETPHIWVFNGEQSAFPSGAFSTRELAERWIGQHKLTGMLTAYPLDQGAYQWAIEQGVFTPTKDYQHEAKFIGRFTSAALEHYHYEDGIC